MSILTCSPCRGDSAGLFNQRFLNTTDSKFINNLLQLNQENKKAVNDELASLHTGEALICNYEGTTIASARDYLSHIIRVSLSNFSADDYPELFGTIL